MLHPSSATLSYPLDYFSELWTERQGEGGGSINPGAGGMQILLASAPSSWFQTQLTYGFNAADKLSILVSARLRAVGVASCEVWFGVWNTQANPFAPFPALNGVFWKLSAASPATGRVVKNNATADVTGSLGLVDGQFVDLAIIIRNTGLADFLYSTQYGSWESIVKVTSIPDSYLQADVLRPSLVCKRLAAGTIQLDVRSLYIDDLALRRVEK